MSLNAIDKYVAKKKRDLLGYAKILESVITLDDNKLWQDKKDFIIYAKEVIDVYADAYYFDNNANRSNPVLYSNDNINFVLRSIIEYFKKSGQVSLIKERKNETFLLSVIICTACYVDFATNVVDGNFSDTRAKFRYLLDYLKKTKVLTIKENKYWVNDLFNAVKRNMTADRKFLDSFVSSDAYNNYYTYNGDPLYYMFEFKYTISGTEGVDSKIIADVAKKYEPKFLEMSYELLIIHLLEEYISNKDMGIALITANAELNKKNNLIKMFDNKYLKPFVKLYVPFQEESNYLTAIKAFNDIGIKTLYEYKGNDTVDDRIFTSDMEILVSQEFLNNNADNKLSWDRNNIKFIVKNKED